MLYLPPPYPADYLPDSIRNFGMELDWVVQTPTALTMSALLGCVSMCTSGLIDVKIPTGQVRPPSLFLLVRAESGERKTTLDNLVFSVFYDRDSTAELEHKKSVVRYREETSIWEMKCSATRRQINRRVDRGESLDDLEEAYAELVRSKPKRPRLRRFIRQDITGIAIAEALEGDGEMIGLISDEGQQGFKSNRAQHFGMLNKLWDSTKMLSIDRADGDSLVMMNPRITTYAATQSSELLSFLEKHGNAARGTGHFARYLVANPPSNQGYREISINEYRWRHMGVFQERVAELLGKYVAMVDRGEVQRETLEFTADAAALFLQTAQTNEWMIRPGEYLHDIPDFASKAMEIAARLAANFHYFSGESGQISRRTLECAIAVVQWHVVEFKRMFSKDGQMPQDQLDAHALCRWLRCYVWRGNGSQSCIPKNALLQVSPVRQRDRLNAALFLLQNVQAVWIGAEVKNKKKFVNLNDAYFAGIPLV